MSAAGAKLLELLFVLALVFGWGAYELWSLRRDRVRESRRGADPGASDERDRAG